MQYDELRITRRMLEDFSQPPIYIPQPLICWRMTDWLIWMPFTTSGNGADVLCVEAELERMEFPQGVSLVYWQKQTPENCPPGYKKTWPACPAPGMAPGMWTPKGVLTLVWVCRHEWPPWGCWGATLGWQKSQGTGRRWTRVAPEWNLKTRYGVSLWSAKEFSR